MTMKVSLKDDAPDPTTAATQPAAVATLDFLDEDVPLSKKEQMALEKKRQKELKKVQKEQERVAAEEQA